MDWRGSCLTKIFKASPTTNNKAELRAAQQETRRQLFIMKSQQCDQRCNKNAEDIWHPTAVKTLIPNEEANNLARHFATRAAHDTLPEDVKHSLKQLQGQRRQSVLQAKLASTDTDVPFSIHELEAVLRKKEGLCTRRRHFHFLLLHKRPTLL